MCTINKAKICALCDYGHLSNYNLQKTRLSRGWTRGRTLPNYLTIHANLKLKPLFVQIESLNIYSKVRSIANLRYDITVKFLAKKKRLK